MSQVTVLIYAVKDVPWEASGGIITILMMAYLPVKIEDVYCNNSPVCTKTFLFHQSTQAKIKFSDW